MAKFLSEVLDTSYFEKVYFNVIYAPCGSGKTTAAIKKIAPLASVPRKAIYLIDTRLGKDRLSHNEDLTTPCHFYSGSIANNDGFFEDDKKIAVTTYAQFGYWCSCYNNFAEKFELIICDEPHNLVLFSEMGKKFNQNVDVHKVARTAICNAVKRGNVMVVGISATPKPLEKLDCALKDTPIDRSNLHHYIENEIIPYASINSILTQIPTGKRGGLYVKHVQPMLRFGEILRERGFNPLLLWSLSYEKKQMDAAQLAARQYIIEHEAVPDEYDVFLFNATAETSINIRSHMDFFIAHDTGETHITQSRGRYRGNLDTLYIYDRESGGGVVVPQEFIERDLFMDDLKLLRITLDIKKDKKGHVTSIDDMLELIDRCGYTCEKTTKNRRKCVIIHKD